MKRFLFALVLLLTICNVTLSVAYSAVCEGAGGARACGEKCAVSSGECICQGTCTGDEMKWVEGAKEGGDEELLMS